ncbi:DNA gyrase subunit B [Minicystis rosea]|nr:DNA gyrase subunit B [Minicystis rosea]
MYMGDVYEGSGLLHMVWELVANALDEHLAGRCHSISVEIHPDGSVTVEDDGRGIPVHPINGVPFAQVALTSFHTTPTLDGHAPHEHLGLRGVGMMPVNALSSWLQLDSYHGGRHYTQRYARGVPTSPLTDVGPTPRTGTRIRFLPDSTIFTSIDINAGTVARRLRELSYLLSPLRLSFADRRELRYHEPRGLRAFLQSTRREAVDREVFAAQGRSGDINVEAAMTWGHHYRTSIESFANIERTTEGGTHVKGLVEGLVDGLRAFLPDERLGKDNARVRNAVRERLEAVVCVRLQDPNYGAPTKDELVTPRAVDAVRTVVAPAFTAFLQSTPAVAERMLSLLAEHD